MAESIRIALIVLVAAAGWSDLRTRQIPNWITIPGVLLGIGLNSAYGGWYGALSAVEGAGLGLLIFIGLYLAGGMGAGDVKLFAAVGSMVGPEGLLLVFVLTGLLGGITALALMLWRGRMASSLKRTGALLLGGPTVLGRDALRLPYGAVIAAGTLLSLIVLR